MISALGSGRRIIPSIAKYAMIAGGVGYVGSRIWERVKSRFTENPLTLVSPTTSKFTATIQKITGLPDPEDPRSLIAQATDRVVQKLTYRQEVPSVASHLLVGSVAHLIYSYKSASRSQHWLFSLAVMLIFSCLRSHKAGALARNNQVAFDRYNDLITRLCQQLSPIASASVTPENLSKVIGLLIKAFNTRTPSQSDPAGQQLQAENQKLQAENDSLRQQAAQALQYLHKYEQRFTQDQQKVAQYEQVFTQLQQQAQASDPTTPAHPQRKHRHRR